jgi:protein-disulfide isomerase
MNCLDQLLDAMYAKQDTENGGWGSKDDILALTKSLGIDSGKVGQLMTDKAVEYQKLMDADKAEGSANGINGTPGTIIGTQLLSGAQPYAAVKQLIEAELKGK